MDVTLSGGGKVTIRKRRYTDELRARAVSGFRGSSENDSAFGLFAECLVRMCVTAWDGVKDAAGQPVPVRHPHQDRLGPAASDEFMHALAVGDFEKLFLACLDVGTTAAETQQGN